MLLHGAVVFNVKTGSLVIVIRDERVMYVVFVFIVLYCYVCVIYEFMERRVITWFVSMQYCGERLIVFRKFHGKPLLVVEPIENQSCNTA